MKTIKCRGCNHKEMSQADIDEFCSCQQGEKLKPKFKIGDIVKPSNCSPGYQKDNTMVVKYIEKCRSDFINDDGNPDYMEWFSYSENGTGFYPENTIEL